jgi:transposase
MIRILLREELSLKLSASSVGRLLRQLGLSCHLSYAPRRLAA